MMTTGQLTLLIFLAYALVETIDEVFFKKAIDWRKITAGVIVGLFTLVYGVDVMEILGMPIKIVSLSYLINFLVATIGAMNGTSFVHDLLAKVQPLKKANARPNQGPSA